MFSLIIIFIYYFCTHVDVVLLRLNPIGKHNVVLIVEKGNRLTFCLAIFQRTLLC